MLLLLLTRKDPPGEGLCCSDQVYFPQAGWLVGRHAGVFDGKIKICKEIEIITN